MFENNIRKILLILTICFDNTYIIMLHVGQTNYESMLKQLVGFKQSQSTITVNNHRVVYSSFV